MSVQLFTLIPQSNLHAGAGSSNYGVIDNLVQRDVTDQYPCVFASSLKGAFREHYEEVLKKETTETEAIFGGTEKKGGYIFSDAHLLALPVRSNQRAYFMATCPALLQKFLDVVMKDYGYKSDTISSIEKEINLLKKVSALPKIIGQSIPNLKIEDFEMVGNKEEVIPELKKILGNDIVLLSDDDMQYQCSDYALPVLARNCLDNGQSTNLWYEQIIPRKTVFYFLAEKMTSTHTFDVDDKLVQVGGNATVGYGRCQISKR
ncbi:type III-B CRISPR module RAMP protein Cmr4 [Runella zeae]|uniref:type III-B CRISPR module RAMP protein Cmr4 n=1 Tax=Runella zeae TaxID=94255 RepID=UPI000419AE87|nr:type III-B CRISPR module RAMP protein Cmr4 [Runella zeae]